MRKVESQPTHKKACDQTDEIENQVELICQNKSVQVCFGPSEDTATTLGSARDRILFLTMQLARKDVQLVEVQKERDFYSDAFNEAKLQNKKIVEEI